MKQRCKTCRHWVGNRKALRSQPGKCAWPYPVPAAIPEAIQKAIECQNTKLQPARMTAWSLEGEACPTWEAEPTE